MSWWQWHSLSDKKQQGPWAVLTVSASAEGGGGHQWCGFEPLDLLSESALAVPLVVLCPCWTSLSGKGFLPLVTLPSWVTLAHLSLVAAHIPPSRWACAGLSSVCLTAWSDAQATRAAVGLAPCTRATQVSKDTSQPSSSTPPTAVLSEVHLNQKGAFIIRLWGQRVPWNPRRA